MLVLLVLWSQKHVHSPIRVTVKSHGRFSRSFQTPQTVHLVISPRGKGGEINPAEA